MPSGLEGTCCLMPQHEAPAVSAEVPSPRTAAPACCAINGPTTTSSATTDAAEKRFHREVAIACSLPGAACCAGTGARWAETGPPEVPAEVPLRHLLSGA